MIKCNQCGKMFKPDRKDRKLCSKTCRNNFAPTPAKYPWSKWFSMKSFVVRAKDYNCQIHGMVAQIRNRARKLNKKVVVKSRKDGTLLVKVTT